MDLKHFRGKCRCIRRDFSRVHLVDQCLIVFMMILLVQSAYSLIAGEAWAAGASDVDVIVRTAAASIFGYFLSANFIDRGSAREEESGLWGESLETGLPPGRDILEEDLLPGRDILDEDLLPGRNTADERLQILVAAGIGLFCLSALILQRNFGRYAGGAPTAAAAATVTQFRDFVSGCVGFLIGCPTFQGKSERR